MTLHVGLATTLPPAPTGPAEFVAGVLPELARAARITFFVDDHGHRGSIELFMFDLLKGVLDRHLGAVVHNRYAADLIALRAPALPTWVVPLSAPVPAPPASREALGLPDDALVIAHFGFVTQPK